MTDEKTEMTIPEGIADWHNWHCEKGTILIRQVPPDAVTGGGIILPDAAQDSKQLFLIMMTNPQDAEAKDIRAGDWITIDPPLARGLPFFGVAMSAGTKTPIYGWTDIDSYAMYFKGPREETPDA